VDRLKFAEIVAILEAKYRRDLPAHIREDPYRTLIGCILSARTKDYYTDKAYNALFSRFKSPEEVAQASEEEICGLIKPVNFYITKAKRIRQASEYILQHFGGKVPEDRAKLLEIPGIGEKCADIVLNYAFGHNTVAVDTHVEVVAKRLGVARRDAKYGEVKAALEQMSPPEKVGDINNLFVEFGQQICTKNRPKCSLCPVYDLCEWEDKKLYAEISRRKNRRKTRRGKAT